MVCDTSASNNVTYSKFGIPISNNTRDFFLTRSFYKLGQGQSDPKMVRDTPPSKVANLGFLLLIYKRYAPDPIFRKTSLVIKVTKTHKWYKTLHHPKRYSHSKIGFPISNNIRDIPLTQLLLKLGQRSRSQ